VQATHCPSNDPRNRERQHDKEHEPLRVIDPRHLSTVDPLNQVIEKTPRHDDLKTQNDEHRQGRQSDYSRVVAYRLPFPARRRSRIPTAVLSSQRVGGSKCDFALSAIRPPTWMLSGTAMNTKNAYDTTFEIQIGLAAS
jgi:hypothetical protein